ncbi:MAG: GNAT family N-acetyltransferase [Deltaproteobacteria bacterium]|nr:GNAT family N-acetyltransferase [Deltaproteobacteria bacterium]
MMIHNVPAAEWRRNFTECSPGHIYQDPRWLELIEAVYPHLRLHRLVIKEGDGGTRCMLPLVEMKPLGKIRSMLISVLFGNYGGFLFPRGLSTETGHEEIQALQQYFQASKAFAIELRTVKRLPQFSSGDVTFKKFEIQFPSSADELWKDVISGNARTSVRKAERCGVAAEFENPDAIDIFQALYERHASFMGTPIHRREWYRTMAALFRDEALIILARCRGRYAGALLILNYGRKYILHTSVADPAFRDIPVSDILIWKSLEYLMKVKLTDSFDFGRTRPVAGQLFFKRKWGGIEEPVYYSYSLKPGYEVPRILPESGIFRPAVFLWRHLPLWLTARAGPFLRSRIPT